MSKISFRVKLDVVYHAMVPGVPEVAQSAALGAGHAEVVAVAREVGLARHADVDGVADIFCFVGIAAIITVGFVVTWAHEVSLLARDVGHLIIEFVQDLFVDFGAVSDCGVSFEALYLFFKPIIRVSNVAGVPNEVIGGFVIDEGLDCIDLAGFQRIVSAFSNMCGETIISHRSQIHDNGNGVRFAVASRTACLESIRRGDIAVFRLIVIHCIRLQTSDLHVIVVCSRGVICHGYA